MESLSAARPRAGALHAGHALRVPTRSSRGSHRARAVASTSGASDGARRAMTRAMRTRTRATRERERASQEDLSFWGKMQLAYRIFFPPSAEDTARMEAKKRLRMILVADRCTMSESSMDAMKAKILDVVGEFVDVDEDQEVDVSMNTDEELGTMYAVSIPVRRVKAEYDAENDAYMIGAQFVYDDENVWEEEEER